MTDTPTIATPSPAQAKIATLAKLSRTLMGGTRAMRAAGATYLPQFAAETNAAHKARIDQSTLFGAFRKTVEDMTGRMFRLPITLKDDVPAQISAYAEDIDLAGRHLNVFARDVFFDALQAGIGYILVDAPLGVQREDGRPATRADEIAAGFRPYLVYIPAERLIGGNRRSSMAPKR